MLGCYMQGIEQHPVRWVLVFFLRVIGMSLVTDLLAKLPTLMLVSKCTVLNGRGR